MVTGNESERDVAELVATALESYLINELEAEVQSVVVNDGFQPWIEVTLRNGASWQITPVRSGWPEDGTSEQFSDVEQEVCKPCGAPVGRYGADDYRVTGQGLVCDSCWQAGER